MTGPSQCLVSQFSATSCLPAGYAHHCLAISRAHSELVKFSFHDTEYDKVFHILVQLREMSVSRHGVGKSDEPPQLAMITQNKGLPHLSADRTLNDNQMLRRSKRPVEDAIQSPNKRARVFSSPTEELPGHASDPLVSDLPSENSMSDLKKQLIEQLYFEKIDERLTHLTPAQGTTCRWFLTKPEYLAWHNPSQRSDHGGFLWIKGNPGTGKSTLMKFLFETAKFNTKSDPSQITLSFFFLARGTVEEKTTTGLYRSLLHQLFENASDLRDSLDWMTSDGARNIQRNGWQDEALKQTLTHAVQKLGQRSMTIFVDALDECNENQAEGMIFFFEELCHRAMTANVALKVCFSSRHYPTIVIEKGLELVLEDADEHAEDIRQFIRSRLRLKNSKQVQLLRSEILQKSFGIFLWVVLVIDILNSDKSMPISKIRERLQHIPPKLNDLFDMILDRDKNNLQELELCLKWILFAKRPLKAQSLYFAVQFGCDQKCSGVWDQDDMDPESIKIFVRSSSKGLAEVTRNKASEVQFIHESVREYLLGRYESQWSGHSSNFLGDSHELLRKGCLAQIVAPTSQLFDIPEPLPTGPAAGQLRDAMALRFPFLQYAVFNVFYHANAAQGHEIDQQSFLARFPLETWVNLRNALERYDNRRYTRTVTLLYILAEQDARGLIRVYSKRKACFEIENERFIAPALAAMVAGNWGVVQAFSEAHAECQPPTSPLHRLCAQDRQLAKGKEPGKYAYKPTTFRSQNLDTYLFRLGNESIVFAFILSSSRFIINRMDISNSYEPPLSWAARRGLDAVVELLLDKGADVDLAMHEKSLPICLAAANGHEAVVKLLFDRGVDSNLRDRNGKTLLCHSALKGNQEWISLLLKNGADIEGRGFGGWTPLLEASLFGREAMVKLLLEKGANIESRDDRGVTALMHASIGRNYNCVEILLANGANIESKDLAGRTPLSWAVEDGTADAIRLLIEKGADIDSRDSKGRTPLSWAAERGAADAIRLLTEKGADLESKDIRGQTPLFFAVKRSSNLEIIEILLGRGANIETKDNDGRTPLHIARSWCKDNRAVALLLHYDAKVD